MENLKYVDKITEECFEKENFREGVERKCEI